MIASCWDELGTALGTRAFGFTHAQWAETPFPSHDLPSVSRNTHAYPRVASLPGMDRNAFASVRWAGSLCHSQCTFANARRSVAPSIANGLVFHSYATLQGACNARLGALRCECHETPFVGLERLRTSQAFESRSVGRVASRIRVPSCRVRPGLALARALSSRRIQPGF